MRSLIISHSGAENFLVEKNSPVILIAVLVYMDTVDFKMCKIKKIADTVFEKNRFFQNGVFFGPFFFNNSKTKGFRPNKCITNRYKLIPTVTKKDVFSSLNYNRVTEFNFFITN